MKKNKANIIKKYICNTFRKYLCLVQYNVGKHARAYFNIFIENTTFHFCYFSKYFYTSK